MSEYQLWVLSGKEEGAYPLIGESTLSAFSFRTLSLKTYDEFTEV